MPHIRGNYFCWEAFIDAFADDSGRLDYFSFWSGFNFPGEAYINFLNTFSHDLTKREQAVKDAIFSEADLERPFYIVGALDGAVDTMRHELLHALYHIDESYRDRANELVESTSEDVRAKLRKGLQQLGYSEEVHADETQAYLATGSPEELGERFDLTIRECSDHTPRFRNLAEEFLDQRVI